MEKVLTHVTVIVAFAIAFFVFVPIRGMAQTDSLPRTLRVEDILKLESFDSNSFKLAPDGIALAFGMNRPLETARTLPVNLSLRDRVLEIDFHSRGDVWLQENSGRPARNLTRGQSDGSGWWNAHWSPDDRRLARLSSRGGHIAIWIWDRAKNALYELAKTRNIDMRSSFRVSGSEEVGNYVWLDDRRILYSIFSDAKIPYPTAGLTLPHGTELTASPLDSSVSFTRENQPPAQMSIVDSVDRSSLLIADEIVQPSRQREHLVSARRTTVALMKVVGIDSPSASNP